MASHGPLTTSGSQGTAPARGAGAQPAEPCASSSPVTTWVFVDIKKDGGWWWFVLIAIHVNHSYDLMTIVMVVAAICCCYQLVPCFEQLYYCHLIHWGCQVAMATWGWLWVFGSDLSLYSALFKSAHSIMQKCGGNVFKDAKHQLRGKVSLFVCFFL